MDSTGEESTKKAELHCTDSKVLVAASQLGCVSEKLEPHQPIFGAKSSCPLPTRAVAYHPSSLSFPIFSFSLFPRLPFFFFSRHSCPEFFFSLRISSLFFHAAIVLFAPLFVNR